MTAPATAVREYEVRAGSAPTFGRVLCNARNHHFVVDGPVQNGCPGEAPTPAEIFLSAVAACGVEIIHVISRDEGIPLQRVAVTLRGMIDRSRQAREDVTLFNSVRIHLVLSGVDEAQAAALVKGFQRRCPLYGTVATATADVEVTWQAVPAGA
ncbi:MAG TPA: OsmC family protein [Thermoanaerobaculia bacterium]|nr:OsmC family protein [Thermoanaerobaculia bacterium]